jgi:hypothetical protein
VVDPHNVHRGIILRGRTHHNLLATNVDMSLCLILSEVCTRAVSDILCTGIIPIEVLSLLIIEDLDLVAID